MRAITIRRTSDGKLLAFGPENGMYDPIIPVGSTRAVEPDYESVLAEHLSAHGAPRDKRSETMANPQIPQWFKEWID